jgi:phenylacetate-CoA ligase
LARAISEQQLTVHSPQAIIVGAEKIYDHQRTLIEQVFAAPVFETYGSREFSLIGAECEQHNGFHVTSEHLLVEVLNDDGSPTALGQVGNLVITDLFNRAMPFIRYVIGDLAIAGLSQCSCGRGLPVLGKVTGRQVDRLVTADGRQLAGELFPHLLKEYSAVRQFQVVQRQPDEIEIKLVVRHPWPVSVREALRRDVQHAIGASTKLFLEEVEHIPLTPAGKLRVVIAHQPH